jgi:hypothetical protein
MRYSFSPVLSERLFGVKPHQDRDLNFRSGG